MMRGRGILAALLLAGGLMGAAADPAFPDVPPEHWAREAIDELAADDLVIGYPDGLFHGDRPMTRYEYAMVIWRLKKLLDARYVTYDALYPVIDELVAQIDELRGRFQELAELKALLLEWKRGEERARLALEARIKRLEARDRDLQRRMEELERGHAYVVKSLLQMGRRIDGLSAILALTNRDLAALDDRVRALEAWKEALDLPSDRDIQLLAERLGRNEARLAKLEKDFAQAREETAKALAKLDRRLAKEEAEAGFKSLELEGRAYYPTDPAPAVDTDRLLGTSGDPGEADTGGGPGGALEGRVRFPGFELGGALGPGGDPLYGRVAAGGKELKAEAWLGSGFAFQLSPVFADPASVEGFALRFSGAGLALGGYADTSARDYAVYGGFSLGPLSLRGGIAELGGVLGQWGWGRLKAGSVTFEAEGWRDPADYTASGYYVTGRWNYDQIKVRGSWRDLAPNALRFAGAPDNEPFLADQRGYGLHFLGEGFFRLEAEVQSFRLAGDDHLGYWAEASFGQETYLSARYGRASTNGAEVAATPAWSPGGEGIASGLWGEVGSRSGERLLALRAGTDRADASGPYYLAARVRLPLGDEDLGAVLYGFGSYRFDGAWDAKAGAKAHARLDRFGLEAAVFAHTGSAYELLARAGVRYRLAEKAEFGLHYAYYEGAGWSETGGAPESVATAWVLSPDGVFARVNVLRASLEWRQLEAAYAHTWGDAGTTSAFSVGFRLRYP